MAKLRWFFLTGGVIAAAIMIASLLYNNCCSQSLSKASVQQAFDQSIEWVNRNEAQLLEVHNPKLWEFIDKAAKLSRNPELTAFFSRYRQKWGAVYRDQPLGFQINGITQADYARANLAHFPYYNILFMYGFSCHESLKALDVVQAQLEVDFCDKNYPISPACKTHQMMGFLYMRDSQCEATEKVERTIAALADAVARQLIFDIRVVDVYLQRVTMLYESGNRDLINPRWVNRVVDAQNSDGGWDDFGPIVPLGGGKAIGFTAKSLAVKQEGFNFHATAQGIYLMALILDQEFSD